MSEKTRNPNGLSYTMRRLFNKSDLTAWEYAQFKKMCGAYAKQNNLLYDYDSEQFKEKPEEVPS